MLSITIETTNAAFEDDVASELHACLSFATTRLWQEMQPVNNETPSWIVFPIRDTNGNTVGKVEYRKPC